MSMNKKFDYTLHYFRAVCITMIVAVHFFLPPKIVGLEWEATLIARVRETLFHSASLLFVFISGYLFYYLERKKLDVKKMYIRKIQFVVFPYLFMSCLVLFRRQVSAFIKGDGSYIGFYDFIDALLLGKALIP